jgi:hypothetical protein
VAILRDSRFWIGFLVGYLFLVVFPQFNVRAMGIKASVGKA